MKSTIFSKLTLVTAVAGLAAQAQAITWTSHNGHDYAFVETSSNYSWSSAQSDAQSQSVGGYLAYLTSITSLEENNFVYSIIPSAYKNHGDDQNYQVWLGGHQAANQSSKLTGWLWESGEAWTYAAWANGEPNDAGSTNGGEGNAENFLTMNRYGSWAWNDVPNTTPVVGYIVERQYVPDGGSSLALLGVGIASLMALRRKTA